MVFCKKTNFNFLIYIAKDKIHSTRNDIFKKTFKEWGFSPSFHLMYSWTHQQTPDSTNLWKAKYVYQTIQNIFLMLNQPLK